MTLTQYRLIHGVDGLQKLAESCGCKVGYLVTLSYSREKEPSLSLARALVAASQNLLDYESLCRAPRVPATAEAA